MTPAELVSHLQGLDVKLWLDGDRLRYSAPRGVMSQALLEKLAEHKEGVREFLKRARGAVADSSAPAFAAREHDGELPLSFAQQRMWLINQLAPANPAYNVATAVRLEGALNPAALGQALEEIVRRHEVLRTTFAAVGGRPQQVINPSSGRVLTTADLSALTDAGRKSCVYELASRNAEYTFDLSAGPLLTAALLRLGEREHVLLLATHHIVSDGWSLTVLTREAMTLYAAFAAGRPSPLEELRVQYADFAVWQREWLEGGALEKQLDYWKHQLADLPPALELPIDRARPAVQTNRGAYEPFVLGRALSGELRALARREGATLFMVMLAAFETLLYRYTGQTDISIGTPIANRNRAETEGLIGFFVNTLVLRARLDGGERFTELLRRVRGVTLGAYANQDVPFEKLVEELQPERDTSRSALFQVMLAFQNMPREGMDAPGLKASPLEAVYRTAAFDLTLDVDDGGPELRCLFEYNTDLFDAATIRRAVAHFRTLLEGVARDPLQRLAELPVLTEAERGQLLAGWNDTAAPFPADKAVHQLFEERTAARPDAVALVFQDRQLADAELNARANRLAHRLRRLGVGPETLVSVCLERSFEMAVALLGVLKAGGAYVPLDAALPQERLAFMLADTRARVVISQRSLVPRLGELSGALVLMDEGDAGVPGAGDENPRVAVSPRNLAYVIYTSGSTGRPKGVCVTHRSLCNYLRWMQDDFPLSEGGSVLQLTSFSFDVSVWEFFGALTSGARLVLLREGEQQDIARVAELLRERRVSVLQTVPGLLRVLLDGEHLRDCSGLRRVYCGGEAMSRELAARFRAQTRAELYNMCGPTETTIDAAHLNCDGALSPSASSAMPLGRPVANTRFYVLDAAGRLCPVGVTGEWCIGGEGLARGYWANAALTAEKFVPDPFSGSPGAQLYRSGDLVRRLAGGEVEYVGRVDHQVKLRGFRIELGEIEAALAQLESVCEAVAAVRGVTEAEKQLFAYVVAEAGRRPTAGELLEHLRGRLPEYMVPAAFVFLDEMPLLPNGKIDRRALPAPSGRRADFGRDFAAPLTDVERSIAAVWQDVLCVEDVSVHDNFFDLGGHSLLMIQAQEKLSRAFGRKIPLIDLFTHTTISALARHLSSNGHAGESRQTSRAEKLGQGKERMRQLKAMRRGTKAVGEQG